MFLRSQASKKKSLQLQNKYSVIEKHRREVRSKKTENILNKKRAGSF